MRNTLSVHRGIMLVLVIVLVSLLIHVLPISIVSVRTDTDNRLAVASVEPAGLAPASTPGATLDPTSSAQCASETDCVDTHSTPAGTSDSALTDPPAGTSDSALTDPPAWSPEEIPPSSSAVDIGSTDPLMGISEATPLPDMAASDIYSDMPADTSADIPPYEPVDTPEEAPADQPVDMPPELPTDEPVETPPETPTDEPVETPIETPTSEPTETVPSDETPTPQPELTVELVAPGAVSPGAVIPYTVRVTNQGSATAPSAIVHVTYPDGKQGNISISNLAPGQVSSGTLSWTAPAIPIRAGGESTSDYATRLAAVDGADLIARAEVEWQNDAGGGSSAAETSTTQQVPILSISANLPTPLIPGQLATLDLTVQNSGLGAAAAIAVHVVNPDGGVSAATAPALAAGESTILHTTWQAPTLTKGANESDAAYRARLAAADEQVLAFALALEWADGAGGRYGLVEQAGSSSVAPLPILAVALQGPGQAREGSTITYRLTLTNDGHADTSAIGLAVTLPDGSVQRPDLGAALAPGAARSIDVPFTVPSAGIKAPQPVQVRVAWQDSSQQTYGPISAEMTTVFPAPPAATPTSKPTAAPTAKPTVAPTAVPTAKPTAAPTAKPTVAPTAVPTAKPTATPTTRPTATATTRPTATATPVQPVGGDGSPFGGSPRAVPGTIQAEDFNTGGQGVAYNDTDTTNNGGQHRPNEAVDIQATTDTGGGFNVGWVRVGEWLKYTVNVQSSGSYTFNARVAGAAAGGGFHAEIDGVNVTGALSVPNTGSWQTWTTVSKSGINLSAGQHILRVVFDTPVSSGTSAGNYNFFSFVKANPVINVEAESCTLSQAVVATNHTGFSGSGFVDYSNVAGSYMECTVSAAAAGSATLTLRYSNGTTTNRPMSLSVNGTVVNGSLAFNSTTNWDTWATQTINVTLNAGSNTIRMTATTVDGGPNLDRITIE